MVRESVVVAPRASGAYYRISPDETQRYLLQTLGAEASQSALYGLKPYLMILHFRLLFYVRTRGRRAMLESGLKPVSLASQMT